MTDKELVAKFRKSRCPEDFEPIISRHLQLVTAATKAQMEDPEGMRKVIHAVFQALARRLPRLSKKTSLPGWLVRSSVYGVREWKRNHPPLTPASQPQQGILQALNTLPAKYSDALVTHTLGKGDASMAASSIPPWSQKREKWITRGFRRLKKRTRKKDLLPDLDPAQVTLDFLIEQPEGLEGLDPRTIAAQAAPQKDIQAMARDILRKWSWLHWQRRLKNMAWAVGCLFLLIAAMGLSIFWAWETGHFMAWMVQFGAREVLKEAPELGLPPRVWNEQGLLTSSLQKRDDLFGPTNIWRADFTFTPTQWKGIRPSKIKPVKIFSDDGNIVLRNPHAKRSGLSGVLGIQFNWTTATLVFGKQSFTNIATRYRGNGTYVTSLYGQKQPIKIDLNKHAQGQVLMGMDRLNFNNLIEDATFMHDALGYALFRSAGVAAPRTAYAWITIKVHDTEPPRPYGFYLVLENIDARFAKDRFGNKKTPVFKPVTPFLFQYLGEEWSAYEGIYDLKTSASEYQKQRVIDFARSLTHDNDETFDQRVGEFLDLDQFSRYLASIVLISSYDGFLTNGQNFYMYLDPKTNLFGFIPWDLDHAWGDFPHVGTASERDQASIWHPWTGQHLLLQRVMKVEAFRTLYRKHLENLLATAFNSTILEPQIDIIASVIRDPIEHDNPMRYRRFLEAVSNDKGPPPKKTEGLIRPVNAIKRFIAARSKSVQAQLDGLSEGVILEPMMKGPDPSKDQ
ncbi:MAG: CotH kinase family protein [Verrucomicrobiota bacterium]|nr:CotH kinase family protein [Verrucomicrobiota bacterium]